jgi:hypothetical protein
MPTVVVSHPSKTTKSGTARIVAERIVAESLRQRLDQLSPLPVRYRHVLLALVQIATYSLHRSAPFLRALVLSAPSLLGRWSG